MSMFTLLDANLSELAKRQGGLDLTIPMAYIEGNRGDGWINRNLANHVASEHLQIAYVSIQCILERRRHFIDGATNVLPLR